MNKYHKQMKRFLASSRIREAAAPAPEGTLQEDVLQLDSAAAVRAKSMNEAETRRQARLEESSQEEIASRYKTKPEDITKAFEGMPESITQRQLEDVLIDLAVHEGISISKPELIEDFFWDMVQPYSGYTPDGKGFSRTIEEEMPPSMQLMTESLEDEALPSATLMEETMAGAVEQTPEQQKVSRMRAITENFRGLTEQKPMEEPEMPKDTQAARAEKWLGNLDMKVQRLIDGIQNGGVKVAVSNQVAKPLLDKLAGDMKSLNRKKVLDTLRGMEKDIDKAAEACIDPELFMDYAARIARVVAESSTALVESYLEAVDAVVDAGPLRQDDLIRRGEDADVLEAVSAMATVDAGAVQKVLQMLGTDVSELPAAAVEKVKGVLANLKQALTGGEEKQTLKDELAKLRAAAEQRRGKKLESTQVNEMAGPIGPGTPYWKLIEKWLSGKKTDSGASTGYSSYMGGFGGGTSSPRMSVRDDVLYSYDTPIALIDREDNTVMLNSKKYSNTTTRQQRGVEAVAAHLGFEVVEAPLAEAVAILDNGKLSEVAPPGWEGTVKKMKQTMGKGDDEKNPWALAWHMKKKGYKPHYKVGKSGKPVKKKTSKKK